ncbi:hypothetical protein VQ02_33545 [Methylobacterium variabile]|jgi:hypothetical protein|uniref:Uncharacterized protein n=1 Tax=Methylobacterium variabile TaxID=298794 RepID=A0A0J6S127_9HYPH|nr:hypothetical protein VQ02_33545 [Methylobacterium variabile]
MQVDWAVMRRGAGRLSVFVATLGWSRTAYLEFVTDERLEQLEQAIKALEVDEAERLAGTPAIVKACRSTPASPWPRPAR